MKNQWFRPQLSRNEKIVVTMVFMTVVFWFWPTILSVYADLNYGGESQVQSFFDGAAGFMVKTLGTGVFILGMIVAGIKVSAGDRYGLKSAVMVMIGGAVIFLAKTIVGLLAKYAGVQ